MKLTKNQIKTIIQEEVSNVRREQRKIVITPQEANALKENKIAIPKNVSVDRGLLNENPLAAAGVGGVVLTAATTALVTTLIQMLASAEGRESLADLAVALPELMIKICDVNDVLGSGMIATISKKLCRLGLKAGNSPLYLLAYLLRSMDDNQGKALQASLEAGVAAGTAPAKSGASAATAAAAPAATVSAAK
jgi:hypothetical protein